VWKFALQVHLTTLKNQELISSKTPAPSNQRPATSLWLREAEAWTPSKFNLKFLKAEFHFHENVVSFP